MTLYAKNTASMGRLHGGTMFPRNMNPEEFAARKRLSALYLARIARATREKRQELLVEWAEKLYDPQVQVHGRRVVEWARSYGNQARHGVGISRPHPAQGHRRAGWKAQ